jgi:hypothetical protein
MSTNRKDTYKKSTKKRKENLISQGKKRLDTFVEQSSILKIDEFKQKNNLSSRGEALDQLLKN